MEKTKRFYIFIIYTAILLVSTVLMFIWGFINLNDLFDLTKIWNSLLSLGYIVLALLLTNEAFHWAQEGKRSDSMDLIILAFLFVAIMLLTENVMTAFIGAFSIYMIFGISELKDYEVMNKILWITVITYNFIFIAGITDAILLKMNPTGTFNFQDTAFSMSIWVMLILGFAFFGRKYIIVFRFMSPQYITMFLFMIAWMFVRYLTETWQDITEWIYLIIIITNWFIYLISGPMLDLFLGIKRTDNEELMEMVAEVQEKVGVKGKIKVGFGKYPILNAMAYGATFDKRVAIIAPDINSIPKDELKGIIGHEFNHLKGGIKNISDTLMLSAISTVEILIFWILDWPLTLYDYTFDTEAQPFPMWQFMIISMGINIILYIFVRVLEGYADLNTKKVGLGNELAKGLYNLEGFYSTGREIGLDTMLLSDEKISEYNRITNYADTAEYLNRNMLYPHRLTLLSNLLNSHPPTYHRIVSMYSNSENVEQLKPWREALLPFSLQSKRKRRYFALEYWNTRNIFQKMANEKFKSMFAIDNYSNYMNELKKKELYALMINKTYLYYDKYKMSVNAGLLIDIEFNDDISNPLSLIFHPFNLEIPDNVGLYSKKRKIKLQKEEINSLKDKNFSLLENSKNNVDTIKINPLYVKLIEFEISAVYLSKKDGLERLLSIKLPSNPNFEEFESLFSEGLSDKNKIDNYLDKQKKFLKNIKKQIFYIFEDNENNIFAYSIKKHKMKFNMEIIDRTVGKEIFIEEKGTLKILRLKEYQANSNGNVLDGLLICENERYNASKNPEEEQKLEKKEDIKNGMNFKLNKTIIRKDNFSFSLHNDELSYEYEKNLFYYLKKNDIRVTIYLKKAVNNIESGYVKEVNIDPENQKNSTIVLNNIQKENITLSFIKIETIVFSDDTISIVDKNKMSIGDKMISKIASKRKPHLIFNP